MDEQTTKEFKEIARAELRPVEVELLNQWLADGKGIAIYENRDFNSPECGHRQYMTSTTFAREPYNGTPPQILPDTADRINWRYCLVGVYTGEPIS